MAFSSKAPSELSQNFSQESTIIEIKENAGIEIDPSQEARAAGDIEKADESGRREGDNIPQADGGKDAWLFLAGCFVYEALVWGFPFSFGVFQSYYTTHPPFSQRPTGIAVIGTCSTGIMYLFAPISLYALEAWPSVRRLSSIVGLIVIVSALIASSFSTRVWHLILTQGILYAIGGSLLYSPTMFYLDEWFIKRKGLAFGIMWAGVGTSGLIFPFLLTTLLNTHGFATALRIWSLILAVLCTPLIYFVKARLPPPATPLPRKPISYSFLLTRAFLYLQASNTLESLGFFLPAIYLPSYIHTLSSPNTNTNTHPLPPITGTLLLALLNTFSVLGAIILGHLTDLLPITTVIFISTLGSSLSIFLFWGLGTSLPLLVLFAATYGIFAGGFSAIWTGMMREVQISRREMGGGRKGKGRGHGEVGMGTLMGVFSAGRGVGAVLSGPVSEVLLRYGREWRDGVEDVRWGYQTEYGVLIVFTGVSAVCGLVCFGARRRG